MHVGIVSLWSFSNFLFFTFRRIGMGKGVFNWVSVSSLSIHDEAIEIYIFGRRWWILFHGASIDISELVSFFFFPRFSAWYPRVIFHECILYRSYRIAFCNGKQLFA